VKLEKKIKLFLENVPFFYNLEGTPIDSGQFIYEYNKIKLHLYDNHLGSIVAIQLPKDYQYIICIIACMDLGITYVPLGEDYPEARVQQIKKISEFGFKINVGMYQNIVTRETKSIAYFKRTVNREPVLYILFTSGSTGSPKGVEISRSAYENFLIWLGKEFRVTKEDTVLNATEFTFDVSLVDVGFLLNSQPTMVMSNFKNDLFCLLGEIEKYKISVIAAVPNNFSLIFKDEIMARVDLKSLKYALVAGSRFSENLYHNFIKYVPHTQVYNCYGPTEFTIYCLFKKLGDNNDVEKGVVSIGQPLLNTHALIIDANSNIVDNNVIGELVVSGPQLMSSYKGDIKRSLEVLININNLKYYKTGDLVYKTSEDYFYMVGRVDDTVKVSGFRINLSDVDSYIQNIDKVLDCVTLFIESKDNEGVLVTYLILDGSISTSEIKSSLKLVMPAFQIPKYFNKIDKFPLNSSGKICRKTLKNNFLSG